jgi:hypothetical protein
MRNGWRFGDARGILVNHACCHTNLAGSNADPDLSLAKGGLLHEGLICH